MYNTRFLSEQRIVSMNKAYPPSFIYQYLFGLSSWPIRHSGKLGLTRPGSKTSILRTRLNSRSHHGQPFHRRCRDRRMELGLDPASFRFCLLPCVSLSCHLLLLLPLLDHLLSTCMRAFASSVVCMSIFPPAVSPSPWPSPSQHHHHHQAPRLPAPQLAVSFFSNLVYFRLGFSCFVFFFCAVGLDCVLQNNNQLHPTRGQDASWASWWRSCKVGCSCGAKPREAGPLEARHGKCSKRSKNGREKEVLTCRAPSDPIHPIHRSAGSVCRDELKDCFTGTERVHKNGFAGGVMRTCMYSVS